MATKASRTAARMMISPSVILLLGWMIIPLSLTLYFSFLRYNLLQPGETPFAGWENYYWFFTAAMLGASVLFVFVAMLYREKTYIMDEGEAE